MIPILIGIFLVLIVSTFVLGFLYNETFLYAACVLSIIFGLLLVTNGLHLPTGENTTTSINLLNQTETNSVNTYEQLNPKISEGLGIIFILIGIAFIYFEKKGRQDTKDQNGLNGEWL